MKIRNRICEIFLDDSGKVSMAKCAITVLIFIIAHLVASYNLFALIVLLRTGAIPDLPSGLAGTISALTGTIAALYGTNKFSKTIPFQTNQSNGKEGGMEE